MSRLRRPVEKEKVFTFLLQELANEEVNLIAADEERLSCLAAVERHKDRVRRLREALETLGLELPPEPAATQEADGE